MRHFYRCADCLSVVATETRVEYRDERGWLRHGLCGACGGRMEYMGQVERDRLVRIEHQCPCDARCTSALGPRCDCRCGGANHGSNRVVAVTVDAGGIPTMHVGPKALSKAQAYRQLVNSVRQAIEARYGRVIEAKRRGEYLSWPDFSAYLSGTWFVRQLHAAMELRTHAGRNRRLQALLDDIRKKSEVAA